MVYIYDIEVYQNFFCVTFKKPNIEEVKVFQINKKVNDISKIKEFLKQKNLILVGYNSYNFDSHLLDFIYSYDNEELIFSSNNSFNILLYNLANTLISSDKIRYLKYDRNFLDIDLMKIGGFFKSLKLVGVSLRWPKLQDLPIESNELLDESSFETIIKYNYNDVCITEELYNKMYSDIKLRFEISKKYGVKVYSEPKSGIANKLLERLYSEVTGIPIQAFKKLRTNRKYIKYNDIILKNIQFETKKLKELLVSLKSFIYYKEQPFFKKNLIFNNVKYKLGIGGIHSDDKPGIYEEDDEYYLIDADVESMYPSIICEYGFIPKHIDRSFLNKYIELKSLRIEAKHNNDIITNETFKIVLNSTFGKMLNENHWLYDPKAGLSITVNGQLLILMLIEKLSINGFEIISANTDGIITRVKKSELENYKKLCKEWETITNLKLEFNFYKKYIRRDVNNYMSIKSNKEVKKKGIFETKISLTKGYDKPIVSKALYNYFTQNIPIEKTIREEKDILNFCSAYKIDKKFDNIYIYLKNNEKVIEKLQRSVRYYVSTDGGILIKRSNGAEQKEVRYEANKKVTIFNEYFYKDNYNIDYNYYIYQTQKIIDEIKNPQLVLW